MNPENIKKVKCKLCKQKFKPGEDDIPTIAKECTNGQCELRTEKYSKLIHFLTVRVHFEAIEVPDPIGVEIDEHGKTRTLS